jgi:hypothetical protein
MILFPHAQLEEQNLENLAKQIGKGHSGDPVNVKNKPNEPRF